jgi:signal transduction histidine kinase
LPEDHAFAWGEIQVESYEPQGLLFTFDLPIANADQAQQAA